MSSRIGTVAKMLFVDLLGSIFWFPVWWYTVGLKKVATAAYQSLRYRSQSYGFRIWLKNFFVPMYGQYDLVGRLVSVFMRLVVFIGRGIAFMVEVLIYGMGILLWMLVLPFALISLLANMGAFLV